MKAWCIRCMLEQEASDDGRCRWCDDEPVCACDECVAIHTGGTLTPDVPPCPTLADFTGSIRVRDAETDEQFEARIAKWKGGLPMAVFQCNWPNGDVSFVAAATKQDAIFELDEVGSATEAMLHRVTCTFMVHVRPTKHATAEEAEQNPDWTLESFGEDLQGELMPLRDPSCHLADREGDDEPDGSAA